MQSSNGSMSHLQGKTFFLLFETKDRDGKRTSAKVRGISNDANQEGKVEREKWNKEPHRPFSSRFISIKTEDRRCRNSNTDVRNCIQTHTHIKNFLFFFFHLLLSPLESIQNKKPIFGEENLHFCLPSTCLSAGTAKSLQKEKEQKPKIFHKLTSTPSSGGRPSFQKKFTIISVGKLTHKTF